MLDDPEWSQLTDHEIAAACLVTDRYVAQRRRDQLAPPDVADADEANGSLESDEEQPGDLNDVDLEGIAFDWDAQSAQHRHGRDASGAIVLRAQRQLGQGAFRGGVAMRRKGSSHLDLTAMVRV
jgi:hypothetical protein